MMGFPGSWYLRLRCRLGCFPLLLPLIARWLRLKSPFATLVTSGSDVLVEGFPRSGNSFVRAAFQISQPEPFTVAGHFHFPSHVSRALRLGKPVLILIREPAEAVASFLIFRGGPIDIEQALDEYMVFYQRIFRFLDEVVVADFQEVVLDLGAVMQRLNQRFGTEFILFDHTPDQAALVRERVQARTTGQTETRRMQKASVPSDERDRLKKTICDDMVRFHADKLEAARQLYRQVLEKRR